MAIDFRWTPLPLLAVLVPACSDLASPADRDAGPRSDGESMVALESDGEENAPAPPRRSCELAGQTYLHGSSIPSGDRCTRCACEDGSVSCAAAPCEPAACESFLEVADSVCSRAALDPCIFQDPDCNPGADRDTDAGAAVDAGAGTPVLPARACEVAGQTFADQSDVPSGDDCNTCGCSDGTVACTEIACDPVFCAELIEESDGVCSRFPLDPCRSQDPDCGVEPASTEP